MKALMLKYSQNGKRCIKKKNEHPQRWSKNERNWQPIGDVELNPEQHK